MTAPAAIYGDFCTIKHVPTRKVYQLIIEVPVEAAQAVIDTLGLPMDTGIPVALARLKAAPAPEPTKERRQFSELPYAQQAAMRCQEADFARFLKAMKPKLWSDIHYGRMVLPDVACAQAVRAICLVESRSRIEAGTIAGGLWEALEAEYYAWQRGMR